MRFERHDTFAALNDEWDALADRSGALPWVRPGWIRAWHDAFGTGAPELVAARRDDGTLAALAPLERKGPSLFSPTNWHTPEYELLAEDDDTCAELVQALVGTGARRLQLSFMRPTGGGIEEVRRKSRTRRVIERVVEQSPYIPIEGDFATYRGSLDRSFFKELDRRRRRLAEQGSLEFELLDGRERLDEVLEEGFRVEASGWKGESGTAIVSSPATRAFYTDIARWAASRGWLRLGCLRLDGRLIAFELNMQVDDTYFALKGGYDEEFRRFGPGTLILDDIVRHTFDEGLATYEFLGSDDAYKLDWTSVCRDRILIQSFASSLPGLADYVAYAVGRPLAKKVIALRNRRAV